MDEILSFIRGENGASAVEYALLLVLIAAVIVASLRLLGESTGSLFGEGGNVGDAIGGGS